MLRHQVDEVDEVRRPPDRLEGARVGLGAHGVRAEELAAEADHRRLLVAQPGDRPTDANHFDDRGIQTVLDRRRLREGPGVLHVVGAGGDEDGQIEQRPRDVRLERRAPRAVAPDLPRPRPLGREGAAVEAGGGPRRLGRGGQRRQAAARARVHVVGRRERQGQELRPAGRHLLVERREPRRRARVARHQVDDVDEVGLAEQRHGPAIGLGAQAVGAEDLAAGLDDDRLALVEPRERLAVPHDVDDVRVEAHRHRLHLVQRPLEGGVVLARRDEDGELEQGAAHRGVPARVHAGARAPYRGRGRRGPAVGVGSGDGEPVA